MGFILSNTKAETSAILLSYGKKLPRPFRYSTGQSIQVRHWDVDTQRARLRGVPEELKTRHRHINSTLDKFDKFLTQVIDEASRLELHVSVEYLQNEFDREFSARPKTRQAPSTDFYAVVEAFIQQCEQGRRTSRSGKKISAARIGQYRAFRDLMKSYRPELRISDITIEFCRGWVAWLNSSAAGKKGKDGRTAHRALNTIGKDIKIFKAILRDTHKQGLHGNRIFEHDDFRSYEEAVENVYLSDAELDVLWGLDGLSPTLEAVRDVFLIGCYTGLRISDLGVLERHHIIENGRILKIIPEKTDEPVFIPVHHRVAAIIQKHGGFPRALADQKMNDYIKELCRLAGFTETAVYRRTEGGVVKRYTQQKWERITNHTARRSFATNLYLAGFDTISIMKITGHKTEKSFMRYICVTQRQIANRMLDHPYFQSAG